MKGKTCMCVAVSPVVLFGALRVCAQQRPSSDREASGQGQAQVVAVPETPSRAAQARANWFLP